MNFRLGLIFFNNFVEFFLTFSNVLSARCLQLNLRFLFKNSFNLDCLLFYTELPQIFSHNFLIQFCWFRLYEKKNNKNMKNVKFKMTKKKMNAGLLENKDSEYSWKMKRLLNDSTQNVQSDPTVSSFINLFNFSLTFENQRMKMQICHNILFQY